MKNKLYYFIPVAALLIIGSILFYLRHHSSHSAPSEPAVNEIQKRGEALYRRKVYTPIIETYKKILAQMPDNIDLKKKLAFAYFGAAKYEDAKPLLEEIKDTNAADAETFYELGFIAMNEGKKEIAESFFKRALKIDPEHKGAREMMGKERF